VKGVILHGGSGTRLRPITYTDVKQLLPLAGKPVSEYALMNLIELGIRDVNIVLGEIGSKEVRDYYGDGKKWGVNISYTFQGKPMGIAHAIGLVKEFVGSDDFVVVLGDNYFQNGFLQLLEDFKDDKKDAFVAITEVSNPQQFGVAEVVDGRIVRLIEKPKIPKSNYAVTGVYFLRSSIFPFIDSLKPSWRGELEITEAFQSMIDSGLSIGYSVIKGWWKDTGTPEEFLSCNMMALEKVTVGVSSNSELGKYWRASLEEGVGIDASSKVVGPCFIGAGTQIVNSYIGPYSSIGRNCKIENSHIENSVIMDNVSVNLNSSTIIRDSLIGPSTKIDSAGTGRKFLKFIVGRDSMVEV
jgi:glucose-1-phosphate thymidylyltransferase